MITISLSYYPLLKIFTLKLQRYFDLTDWFYPKNDLIKLYEQIMFKTFYFEKSIFVEALLDKGSLPKYFQIFLKSFSTSNKSPKAAGFKKKQKKDLVVIRNGNPGGFL